MRALAPVIFVAGVVSTFAAVSAESLRYENPALHYSLTVPDGWVRMPDDVLASQKPEGGGPPAVAAFQAPHESWFHVPALIITHHPDRERRPKDLFEEYGHDPDIGKNGKVIVYDDKRGMVLVPERVPSEEGVEIQTVAAYKPGTEGLLQLDFYFPIGEVPAYLDPMVLQVLDSVRFEEGFAMKDLAPGERAPLAEELKNLLRTRPTIGLVFVLGIAFMTVSVLNARRKRKG